MVSSYSSTSTKETKEVTLRPGLIKKGPVPETAAETALLDQLVAEYEQTSGKDNLRCPIKLIRDPIWFEEQRAVVLAELDSHAGGVGMTQKLLDADKAGTEVSIRDGKCLVRYPPSTGQDHNHDFTSISIHCPECKDQHRWRLNRGYHSLGASTTLLALTVRSV